jgi:hypothetical protein
MRLSDRFRQFRWSRQRPQVELVRLQPLPPPSAPHLQPPPAPTADRPRCRSPGYAALSRGAIDPRDNPNPAAGGRPGRRRTGDSSHLDLDDIRAELHAPRIPWWEQ